jgi:flavorubredoxin
MSAAAAGDRLRELAGKVVPSDGAGDQPVCLFDGAHAIYWVGSQEDSPFRCNAYLIVDGDTRILVDPGSAMHHFAQVKARVAAVVPPESVSHIVLQHQDPDLCDSLPDWLEVAPDVTLVTTPRARVLLPYYGFKRDVKWLDVSPNDSTFMELSGGSLSFITAPFLHFPEAMTCFDEASGFLFTGDIGAAVEQDWRLVAVDWEAHWRSMLPFHVFYMASNRALRGYIQKIRPFPIRAMLPQHGSILPEAFVGPALDALEQLNCGIDLLYPEKNLSAVMRGILRG